MLKDQALDLEDEGVESPVPVERSRSIRSEMSERTMIGRPVSSDRKDHQDADRNDRTAAVQDLLVKCMSKMVLTHARFLRATPAHCVSECAGRVLRSNDPKFTLSRSVETIPRFISHSWQGSPLLKALTLQLFYNWKFAVLASNLGALLGMILASLDLLPGFETTPQFGTETMVVGTWSLSFGFLSFVAVWFFWAPREMVFLDRICINQEDPKEKMQGIVNIGACLKRSKNLLVVFDDTYCQRLWCIFELGAFLKTHENAAMFIQPTSLTIFIVVRFLQTFLFWLVSLVLPPDSVLTTPISIGGRCFNGWLVAILVLRYSKELQLMKSQLQNFTFAGATCFCCSVSHQHPANPELSLACDREVLQRCVEEWFGSVEDFEMAVRTRVKDALSLRLGYFCPYPLQLAAGLPILWAQMDVAAARFRQQDTSSAISMIILGLNGLFITSPLVLAAILMSVPHLAHTRVPVWFQQLLAVLVSLGTNGILQLIRQLCERLFGNLLGTVVWSLVVLVPGVLLWRCANRLD